MLAEIENVVAKIEGLAKDGQALAEDVAEVKQLLLTVQKAIGEVKQLVAQMQKQAGLA